MPLVSRLLAGFCSLCLFGQGPGAPPPNEPLRVGLTVAFDRSMTSEMRTLFQREAASIWTPYGVALRFGGDTVAPHLDFDVILTRRQHKPSTDPWPPVLGRAVMGADGVVRSPIWISIDTVESTIALSPGRNPSIRDRELGLALGRVLAHELGHALLGGPPFHDDAGLMKAAFNVRDLAGADQRPFQLIDASAARLRERIVEFLHDLVPPDIPKEITRPGTIERAPVSLERKPT